MQGAGLCRENSKWQFCCHMHFDVWKLWACTFSLPWISKFSKRWRSLQPTKLAKSYAGSGNTGKRWRGQWPRILYFSWNITLKRGSISPSMSNQQNSLLILEAVYKAISFCKMRNWKWSSRKFMKRRQAVSYNKIITHLSCCIIHNYFIYRFCYHTHTTHICCGQHIICFLLQQKWYYLHLKISVHLFFVGDPTIFFQ